MHVQAQKTSDDPGQGRIDQSFRLAPHFSLTSNQIFLLTLWPPRHGFDGRTWNLESEEATQVSAGPTPSYDGPLRPLAPYLQGGLLLRMLQGEFPERCRGHPEAPCSLALVLVGEPLSVSTGEKAVA